MPKCLVAVTAVVIAILTLCEAITDPLPEEKIEEQAVSMRCPANEEFKWKRTDAVQHDIKIFYSCGNAPEERMQTLHCPPGKKATYRRSRVPVHTRATVKTGAGRRQSIAYNPEPNFGIFSSADNADPNILNSATTVYACLKAEA